MTAPLRIGILGAAQIADDGIVEPAKVLGHDLVAVAARDRDRAEAFAATRQFGRWIGADPEIPESPELASADATLRASEIDAAMHVELDYGAGVTGSCTWDMATGP